jgi:ABC-type dipeptide/oligopeptide/nickel transport system permease subunit
MGVALALGGTLDRLSGYYGAVVYAEPAIALTVLGLNLLGDALRDVLDPRLRQV